jgi:VanZ family protein
LTPNQKEIFKTWIAAFLWLAVIALESSDFGSAEYTSRFLYPLLHFFIGIDKAHFAVVHHYIRKSGHFVGYFALSLLLFRAWKATLRLPLAELWAWRWAGIAFAMSVAVASLDEWHQTFLPSRTGRFGDVVLDSSAALTAQLLIFFFWNWRESRMHQVEAG